MSDDPRCCGSGHCMIDEAGRCWCGQQWDGVQMCSPQTRELVKAAMPTEVLGDMPNAQLPSHQ
jgi:sugar lactone lactonase YvrE